jgi:hypothetical protein
MSGGAKRQCDRALPHQVLAVLEQPARLLAELVGTDVQATSILFAASGGVSSRNRAGVANDVERRSH